MDIVKPSAKLSKYSAQKIVHDDSINNDNKTTKKIIIDCDIFI